MPAVALGLRCGLKSLPSRQPDVSENRGLHGLMRGRDLIAMAYSSTRGSPPSTTRSIRPVNYRLRDIAGHGREVDLHVITNQPVIAVDQDPLGRQGHAVASADGHWVLTKLLANGDRAVLLFNQTDKPASISTTVEEVDLTSAPEYTVLDLWSNASTETTGVIKADVPAHGVVFYRIAMSQARSSGT